MIFWLFRIAMENPPSVDDNNQSLGALRSKKHQQIDTICWAYELFINVLSLAGLLGIQIESNRYIYVL